jgi:hypothetical protein
VEWLWIIFAVIGVVSSLMEKQAQKQKNSLPKQVKGPPPNTNRPLPEWAKEFSEFFVVEEEPVVETGKFSPVFLPEEDLGEHKETVRSRNLFEEEEFDQAEPGEFLKGDDPSLLRDLFAEGETRLRDALLLAHVLPRPDFRRFPWQRKI